MLPAPSPWIMIILAAAGALLWPLVKILIQLGRILQEQEFSKNQFDNFKSEVMTRLGRLEAGQQQHGLSLAILEERSGGKIHPIATQTPPEKT